MAFRLFLAIAILSVVSVSPLAVQAQTAGTAVLPTVTVLDVTAIRRDAASMKSIREQIIKYQNELQSEIQKEQEQLRTAQQELAKKQSLLAPEAFAAERRKFEESVVGVQQLVQQRRRSLEESQAKAMQQVEIALNEVVATLAQQNGYAVVLRRSQVVIVDSALDITATVMTELDQRLPTVSVDAPAPQ